MIVTCSGIAAVDSEMVFSLGLLPQRGVADFQARPLFLIHLLTLVFLKTIPLVIFVTLINCLPP